MERVLSICQHCSLPTCPSLVLQILYAFKPSHRFSPSKHPCSSLVSSTYRKLLSGSSLRCRERTTQNRANANRNRSICNECILDFHCGRGELLNCLAALGSLLKLPPALLVLTVLAWGNSVGDLVADVAVAIAGQPAMAMAGCFADVVFI